MVVWFARQRVTGGFRQRFTGSYAGHGTSARFNDKDIPKKSPEPPDRAESTTFSGGHSKPPQRQCASTLRSGSPAAVYHAGTSTACHGRPWAQLPSRSVLSGDNPVRHHRNITGKATGGADSQRWLRRDTGRPARDRYQMAIGRTVIPARMFTSCQSTNMAPEAPRSSVLLLVASRHRTAHTPASR